jgi:maleylpyruvate isomerase
MKLRLHTRYQNSAGQRVRIMLDLKRVPYEYVAIPSLSSDAYRKLNPQD